MTAKEAISILRNAAFSETDKDMETVEAAIDLIEKHLETLRWHPYPKEKPEKVDSYLCLYDKGKLPYHDVCRFIDDLYKFDNVDFAEYRGKNKKKSGFVDFTEYGWGECRPDAWMQIPGNDKE